MHTVLDKLAKILSLEEKMGYTNRAVIGGLEKYAPFWKEEVWAQTTSEVVRDRIERIVNRLADYPTLETSEQRKALVRELLQELQSVRDALEALEFPAGPAYPAHEPAATAESSSIPACDKTLPPLEKPHALVSESLEASPPRLAPRPPELSKPSVSAPAEPASEEMRPRAKPYGLDSPVTSLPNVGAVHASRLANLGVRTIRDLLYLFPRRYDDFSRLKAIRQLEPGEDVTIIANVQKTSVRQIGPNRSVVKCLVSDGTGTMELTWFNQPFLERRLRPGHPIVVSGRVEQYLGRPTMTSPEWEPLDKELVHTGRLVPVYPLTQGVSGRWLRRLIKRTIEHWADRIPDYLPEASRERHHLIPLSRAICEIHFPTNQGMLAEARRRLIFDEFLLLQLGVLRQRQAWRSREGCAIPIDRPAIDRFLSSLPFSLTNAQQRALESILKDISQRTPMNRLLQGDVGSGKTVVAAAAALAAIGGGYQVALMAPTEILAEQHEKSFKGFFQSVTVPSAEGERPITICRLTGSLRPAEKEMLYRQIATGQADLVIGTHALIQEGVQFARLGLVIIDEQQRFGVAQRAALRQKGYNPHVLVMTATPIPRTLSLTIFGDLDISVIDELPPGRQPIQTYIVTNLERERAYQFVRKQIAQGHQAFIICPLIEESDKVNARAAIDEYERLQKEVFPNLRLGLLHGRMSSEEKEAVMRQFQAGELHILVSTPVVEVGIDVPNATVMLIEGANRFGLAQLHQFRGRVGRGTAPSYCLLVSENASEEGLARLQAVAETQNGFILAEKDLEMRGPGEFFGTRQSGLPDLRLAQLGDVQLLELARAEAYAILKEDPHLRRPEFIPLLAQVNSLWSSRTDAS